jgi:hypothetical protein
LLQNWPMAARIWSLQAGGLVGDWGSAKGAGAARVEVAKKAARRGRRGVKGFMMVDRVDMMGMGDGDLSCRRGRRSEEMLVVKERRAAVENDGERFESFRRVVALE